MPAGGSNCIDCHMPKRRAEDAVHVVMTDHYIQRRKPSRDPAAALPETVHAPYRGEVALYYPEQLPPTPERDLYLAIAQTQRAANLQSGIPRLRQAIEKYSPAAPEFYFEMGRAYGQSGNRDEAIHWYEEALRRRPGFRPAAREMVVALLSAGQLDRAAEEASKAAASPLHDAADFANLGNVLLQQGKLEPAGQALQQALLLDPDLPEAHNLLGLTRLRNNDRAGAEKYFRGAIAIQPDLAMAHNNLASLLTGAGDYVQAGYHFRKAIESDPAYFDARYSYGLMLAMTHSYDKAIVELQGAVRLDPRQAQVHSALADLLAARGRLDGAVAEYGEAIRLKPEMADAEYGLGSVLAAQGKNAKAEQHFRLAISRNPDYYEAHLALGSILARKGNLAEARAHDQKAAESPDPDVRQAARNRLR